MHPKGKRGMGNRKRAFNKEKMRGCGERGTLLHCWQQCRLVKPLCKAVWQYLKKLKIGSAFWPSNYTSGNMSKDTQNNNSKEHKHPYVHCSIIYTRQDMGTAQVSINRWVDKTTMGYLHNRIVLGHKKENFTLCNYMDGPGEQYAKWNKPVRERQIPYDLTHMWNLMNKPN